MRELSDELYDRLRAVEEQAPSGLWIRCYNVLANLELSTAEQVESMTNAELLKEKNLGGKSLRLIRAAFPYRKHATQERFAECLEHFIAGL